MRKLLNRLHNKVNSLFLRILLYFLSLLIPIIVIGIVSFAYNVNTQRYFFSNKILANLESSVETVDAYLKIACQASQNFFYDEGVTKLLKPSDELTLADKANLVRISKSISNVKNVVYQFIDNLFVYCDDERVYTSSGADNYNAFFTKFYRYEIYNSEFWKKELNSGKYFEVLDASKVTKLEYKEEPTVIPIVTHYRLNGFNTAMVINISTGMINKTLKNNSIFPSTVYLVTDSDNDIIICSNESYRQNQIVSEISASTSNRMKDEKSDFIELTINDRRCLVTYLKSTDFKWRYYAITPIEEFDRDVVGILDMTLVSCVVLIIIGIVFSFIFSINIYNPIKNIRDILLTKDETQEIYDVRVANKNDLDVIGVGLNNLMNRYADYKEKIKSISNDYLSDYFSYLIRGNELKQDRAIKILLEQEAGFNKSDYLCCVIRFKFKDSYYHDFQDVDRLVIHDGLGNVMRAIMQKYLKAFILEYIQDLYVCVVNINKNDDMSLLHEALNEIKKSFENDFNYYTIAVGIGREYPNLNDIKLSYSDAMTAIETIPPDTRFDIVDAANVSIEQNMYYYFVDENRIVNCIKTGDLENLRKIIENIIKTNKVKGVSHDSMGLLFTEIYNTAVRYLGERGVDIKQFVNAKEHSILTSTGIPGFDYDDRIDILIRVYKRIIESQTDVGEKSGSPLIDMIIRYIESNYNKDVYLEKIAKDLGVSSKYVSRIFKEKIGTNLTDYISNLRITKAKELLAGTNLNINEIAEQVGIYSRTTFARLFKKIAGITPSEYRDNVNR